MSSTVPDRPGPHATSIDRPNHHAPASTQGSSAPTMVAMRARGIHATTIAGTTRSAQPKIPGKSRTLKAHQPIAIAGTRSPADHGRRSSEPIA